MRELSSHEVCSVAGGSGGLTWEDLKNQFEDIKEFLEIWWNRLPCGGGAETGRDGSPCGELTDEQAKAALQSISIANDVAGRYGAPLPKEFTDGLPDLAKKYGTAHDPVASGQIEP